ncbi:MULTISPECIES: T6SS phospholipase effector Tle1-like catalytic domain-containing protein [Chryseobacterium]|uniref:T6SS Phospholipase effector Tle1-like catalytic domain-containing protein n=1 Tax=Chryseobacterium camelliae TaxID=1265445 RepID=A0ABU0TK39_9FLAO|nr:MULTISPECIES: DUF2235 domain-containing protein [Chryseobacterium]MDT3408774.1 hypothetical protein [Pseudacidovorax intermedius]MDQ1097371.1 hypothetical protein [Chryseobacterium camelliae]MDQ1101302.1 hypothetical protein [Chryseobacterium sp. SORGH_AS_1048]MDR6084747.1 hypothetical protein [Chryseobacterium sp. SORGH_AS_0909]MDR6133020.1 hypothetical protein [Chryseobacterium sp. SORGH_AS_1175]
MKNNIISIGIFFDGTGNNGINAGSPVKPAKNNESYYGCPTNIYKLFGLFQGDEKIYVEGIGTVTGAEDSDFAMAICKNPKGFQGYSCDDKLAAASAFVTEKLHGLSQEYHFYIYGFSRGAMLARTFCNQLMQSAPQYGKTIRTKFLGVFDTVESAPFNTYDVTVNEAVEAGLHICAVNECRYFFPLTGFFEDSKDKADSEFRATQGVLREIFVPGVHADIGGGYLEGSQSVYISGEHITSNDVVYYVENIRNTAKDSSGNKLWNYSLKNYEIDEGTFFSQAYIIKNKVYNDLSKIYGLLMLEETNNITAVFSTGFSDSDFAIDGMRHPYLSELSEELRRYMKLFPSGPKPVYDFQKLTGYLHVSANFGLYKSMSAENTEVDAELINNGLNMPSNAKGYHVDSVDSVIHSDLLLSEDSVIDYALGTNIPNNSDWNRTILIKENFYNKC